jgi:hypothetical protein
VFIAAFGEDGFDNDGGDRLVRFTARWDDQILSGTHYVRSRQCPHLLTRIFSYSSRHRFSSAWLCSACSSSGNLISGKGAAGQSKAGTSICAVELSNSQAVRNKR